MRIRGLIFDFNGVIVDDEPLHARAVQQALEEENFLLSMPEYYDKYLPYDDYNCILNILRDHGEAHDDARIRGLISRKSIHYFAEIEQKIPSLKGSVDFIRALPAQLPAVIASGAARREIEFILGEISLRDRFLSVIASGDVINSKPHPEAFLKGFEVLKTRVPDLLPNEVVVFEDSYRAVEAACAAGLRCIGLCTSYSPERLAAADLVLSTLEGWSLERLEAALQ